MSSTSTAHDRTNLARLVRALGAPPAPVADYAGWLALQRALQVRSPVARARGAPLSGRAEDQACAPAACTRA
jgi:hypothetical protein